MDPNFPFPMPQWPQAPCVWPPGFNPWIVPGPYMYGMPQTPMQQPMQQPFTPSPCLPDMSDSSLQHVQATPQQMQQSSLLITPPSDSSLSSHSSRCASPPPSLPAQLQATPTGRPAAVAPPTHAAATAHAALTPPTPDFETPTNPRKRKINDENREVAKRPYDPTNPADQIFCRVGGRLTVVGGQRTYNVTVAEIERRTKAPEFIPLSLLGPLLKRGKVKGCGSDLKQLLESREIISGGGSEGATKRKAPISTLSALLEEESLQLSSDHREILSSSFPLSFLARLIAVQLQPLQLADAARDAAAAGPIIASFATLLKDWTSSSSFSSSSSPSPLTDFSVVTHGLGIEEARSLASLFSRFLLTLEQECHAQAERLTQYPVTFPDIPGPETQPESEATGQSAKFDEVDGRLTLQSRKYLVTMAEITRRLRAPECLNLSTLGSLLRRGKTSNTGNVLRETLANHGIRVDQGRRKGAKLSCFTSLLEEEALILSGDLGNALNRYFPVQQFAATLNSRAAASTAQAIAQRGLALAGASRLAAHLSSTLSTLRLPVSDRIITAPHPYSHLMKNYSALTHGYGPEVCVSFLELFRKVFDACREMLPLTSH